LLKTKERMVPICLNTVILYKIW